MIMLGVQDAKSAAVYKVVVDEGRIVDITGGEVEEGTV